MAIRDKSAEERLLRARAALITGASFFGALSLALKLEERESIGTAATDSKRLIYSPSYIESLSEPETIGLVAHEVVHNALMHPFRRGSRDPSEWNIACDIAGNSIVLDAGFVLPKGAIVDRSFDGKSAEEIYAARQSAKQAPQDSDDGEESDDAQQDPEGAPGPAGEESPDDSGDDESAAGGPSEGQGEGDGDGQGEAAPDPGMCGAVLDAADNAPDMAEAQAQAERMVRQAVAVAARQAGELPAGLRRLVEELDRPRLDWRMVLERFIDDAAERVTDWGRRNKRFNGDFFIPASKPDAVSCVAVVRDVSGSVGDDTMAAFNSQCQAMLDGGRVARLYVVDCDADVQGVTEYMAGDTVTMDTTGGGGTQFAPALEHIAEHCPEAAAIVYLTDLEVYGDAWGDEPGVPVLWAVDGPRRAAPFGEVLPIDPYA
jgi:predicted metal-dependent peptidase